MGLITQFVMIRHPEMLEDTAPGSVSNNIEDIGITRDVFSELLQHPEMNSLLEKADIETATKADLFDALDVDMGGELGFSELIGGLMRLRGPITKSDIVAVRLKVRYVTGMIEDIWGRVCEDADKSSIIKRVSMQPRNKPAS